MSQGVAPELLFLERCIEWLKPGGILGIVMAKGQLDNREAYAVRKFVLDSCQILSVINLHEDTFEPFVGSKASVIFLKKLGAGIKQSDDYRIFMAISNKVGQTSRGEPIFKRDSEGNPIIRDNILVLDEDLSQIAEDYHRWLRGELVESEYRFSVSRSDIKEGNLSFNPIQYLPAYNAALQYVLSLRDDEKYQVPRLGDIARVFNGPRFKRPYAELGVKTGETIRKYFTGTALTQLNSDNVKYLDSSKANKQTKKHLDALTIYKGYILISDSGTLGRVTYTLNQHDGHVATNNLIRVVIKDENLRGYIYQFLKSQIGQKLMLKNAYGTNQEHLEPDVIAEIPIPIPKDRHIIDEIGSTVLKSIEELERSIDLSQHAQTELDEIIPFTFAPSPEPTTED
jgi:type I restriction enzyme M protein